MFKLLATKRTKKPLKRQKPV